MNESVWGVGRTVLTAEKPVPVPLHPP